MISAETARTVRRMLDYLLSGAVPPGDKIPSERQLAEALGVHRPAVREAIRALGFLGLLEVRQGSGTYFRGPDQQLLFRLFEWSLLFGEGQARDLLETRADLEVLACGRAAERRSDDDVATLQELLERMRTSDQDHFADADVAFHAKIAGWPATSCSRHAGQHPHLIHGWVGRNIRTAGTTRSPSSDHVPIYAPSPWRPRRAAESHGGAHAGSHPPLLASRTADGARHPRR